ncbi:MAG: CGNR zinc finger domain-containing protein [Rhizobiaceae bacterium]|jgi:predicted RNA-binding Zn ribbon-like protein|nr:CGNR zinc finger domain-containing protein [Rhizobiaceae bacterium]
MSDASTEAFAWTPHRFSGGVLVLDVCNSVILRHDAAKREDRFADQAALSAFAPAAQKLCAEQDLAARVQGASDIGRLFTLREAADAHFRACAKGSASRGDLADLLEATLPALRHAPPRSLESATAMSALRLLGLQEAERLKTCPACGALFLDKSKNRSRAWCDMAVCGNRAKARRFQAAHRAEH